MAGQRPPFRWKPRRCPACGEERTVRGLETVAWEPVQGQAQRYRCPACGFVGQLWRFAVVPPAGEQPGGGR